MTSVPIALETAAAPSHMRRVSVIGGNTQVDIGLPATVPIAEYIADVVELIDSRSPDVVESEDGPPVRTGHWTLARVGREPIPPDRSLADAAIGDGELLVVRSAAAPRTPDLFDDVIDAVARLSANSLHPWSASAAEWVGLIAGLVAMITAIVVLGVAHGGGLAGGVVVLCAGLLAAGAAVIVANRQTDELTVTMLSLYALLLQSAGAALVASSQVGGWGVLVAGAVVLVVGPALYLLTRAGAALVGAAVPAATFVVAGAVARMGWGVDLPKIGAGAAVVALAGIAATPRIATAVARLALPSGLPAVPADPEEPPHPEERSPADDIGAVVLPAARGLEQRARLTDRYRSGLIAGWALAAAAGALLSATSSGDLRWPGLGLAIAVALVMCLRGRMFPALTPAATLIGSGLITLLALSLVVAAAAGAWQPLLAGSTLSVGMAGVVFGVVGPRIELSPRLRRAADIGEYTLIVLIVPLMLWTMNVYAGNS
ncbi:type VII secretion integral membrane protein EccD [Nocardia alni]|uniref:type VII secretion integral membrane protein EccD n=1 Tax=Nocardia alni TaxID=2815723 RepID=UPI001C215047|nr:type VII secretion integral membrane protein EccD [Nocardia alni]